jgi:hypothetical protein
MTTLHQPRRLARAAARTLRPLALATVSGLALRAGCALAQTVPTPAAPPAVTLPAPAMSVPLSLNPSPYALDVGPLGKWYVSGILTGIGIVQSNATSVDSGGRVDLSNGQVVVQKIDGLVQFYVQAGGYTFPTVGTPYVPVSKALNDYFGPVPEAYLKLVPTASFSIEAGKLPTLIGAEGGFTFQNMNIERGLLWNQEPLVSRGVQATYTQGPIAVNVSLNDGFYSNVYNWVDGTVAWTINSSNTLTFVGGGNLGHTNVSTFATPLAQNNGSIYNVIYTYSHGPWTITPYAQISVINSNAQLGFTHSADSYSGAILANYAFNSNFSLAGRAEYITTTGSNSDGAPSLLYGAGSKAFSLTATPTYQINRFFVRADVSWVQAASLTPGDGFGRNGNDKDQVRGVLETGVMF